MVQQKLSSALGLVLVFAFLAGCAGTVKNMQTFEGDEAVFVPQEGKAMVVFMRPASLGYAIQSSVFDVVDDEPQLVGIVAAKTKVAYQVDPGERLFMVVGESADFMSADLEAGKTYHALVTPRMGWLKARFSLKPVSNEDRTAGKLADWDKACKWVVKSPESDAWAANNIGSVRGKQGRNQAKWLEKADRPRLQASDGV